MILFDLQSYSKQALWDFITADTVHARQVYWSLDRRTEMCNGCVTCCPPGESTLSIRAAKVHQTYLDQCISLCFITVEAPNL